MQSGILDYLEGNASLPLPLAETAAISWRSRPSLKGVRLPICLRRLESVPALTELGNFLSTDVKGSLPKGFISPVRLYSMSQTRLWPIYSRPFDRPNSGESV